MASEEEARSRLTEALNVRRAALRLKWDEVADRTGISVAYLRRIRNNQAPITLVVAAGLEDAVEWARGSIQDVLQGRPPTPLPPPAAAVAATASLGVGATATVGQALPPGVDPTSLPPHEIWIYRTPGLTPQERDLLVEFLHGIRAEIPRSEFYAMLAEAMQLVEQREQEHREQPPNGARDLG